MKTHGVLAQDSDDLVHPTRVAQSKAPWGPKVAWSGKKTQKSQNKKTKTI